MSPNRASGSEEPAFEVRLRPSSLRRKDDRFVGDVASGRSLAGLYSLVATCAPRGLNPFDDLADVLKRVQDHPANAIAELLPVWAPSAARLTAHAVDPAFH